MSARKIWVRATINLQGISQGDVRKVNPESPWVQEQITAGFLVEVDAPRRPR